MKYFIDTEFLEGTQKGRFGKTKPGDIFKVEEFTYESIDNSMLNISYYLLSNLQDFSTPFYFEVSPKVNKVLNEQLKIFGFTETKGVMLNLIKFTENHNLQEDEIKIVAS